MLRELIHPVGHQSRTPNTEGYLINGIVTLCGEAISGTNTTGWLVVTIPVRMFHTINLSKRRNYEES
jgi:hypothetical protein